jgi:hypothetical protein
MIETVLGDQVTVTRLEIRSPSPCPCQQSVSLPGRMMPLLRALMLLALASPLLTASAAQCECDQLEVGS